MIINSYVLNVLHQIIFVVLSEGIINLYGKRYVKYVFQVLMPNDQKSVLYVFKRIAFIIMIILFRTYVTSYIYIYKRKITWAAACPSCEAVAFAVPVISVVDLPAFGPLVAFHRVECLLSGRDAALVHP